MKRLVTTMLFTGLTVVLVGGLANAQHSDDYCGPLKILLQSAKDGFAQAQNVKLPGAKLCNVEKDTRSYGCMWSFEKSAAVAANYQKTLQAVDARFSRMGPPQTGRARGPTAMGNRFGEGEPQMHILRGPAG